ncbi:hypothetical protein [Arthrobacter roseus]|uniref:putative acetyltransferase n=1 Tax=Arthrobacter roseus TaxID=136274 RepID=UPI0019625C3F|nr:hypothetical protein [Arthrobacter roseus]MBM7849203.1 hypothetical protein [Arthrobacter roseus]
MDPLHLLRSLVPGSRVVVRYRIDDGLTDALGDLLEIGESTCTVRTRRDDVFVPLAAVTAARAVPPPPPRRSRAL